MCFLLYRGLCILSTLKIATCQSVCVVQVEWILNIQNNNNDKIENNNNENRPNKITNQPKK